MKHLYLFILIFFSLVWSVNVMAFEVDGINYDVLSESDKTAYVAHQAKDIAGDVQILSQVSYEGAVYSVTKVGTRAFYECAELTSVRLPDNITEIGDDAFIRCRKLKDINIPKNLQRLGEYVFAVCEGIEELTLPKTLTEIGVCAFYACQNLRTLTVEEGNPKYLTEDGVLFNRDKTTLILFPAQNDITHYDIPATVTTIEVAAFSVSKLKSVTLPSMLKKIGAEAFVLMDQMESITTNRPAYIGLSHELAHIADRINGSADYGAWVPGNYDTGIIEIPKYEQFACFIENLIRMEHGVSLRSHYGVTTSGKPFEPSRIIDKEGNLFNFRPFSY